MPLSCTGWPLLPRMYSSNTLTSMIMTLLLMRIFYIIMHSLLISAADWDIIINQKESKHITTLREFLGYCRWTLSGPASANTLWTKPPISIKWPPYYSHCLPHCKLSGICSSLSPFHRCASAPWFGPRFYSNFCYNSMVPVLLIRSWTSLPLVNVSLRLILPGLSISLLSSRRFHSVNLTSNNPIAF